MKKNLSAFSLLITIILFTGYTGGAQTADKSDNKKINEMKTYLIERNIPEAGKLTPGQLKDISQKSCTVLKTMGTDIQWVHSYVTGDKIFCVYKAKNEELIKEHGKEGGFPVTKITEISSTISPATAEEHP